MINERFLKSGLMIYERTAAVEVPPFPSCVFAFIYLIRKRIADKMTEEMWALL